MISSLDSIIIYVSDLDRSINWYQETLGLKIAAQHGHFATFQLGGVRLSLHAADLSPDAKRADTSMPVFLVEDYKSTIESMEKKGVNFIYENQIPTARFGTFLDPDGNPIQIIERF